MTLRGLMAVVSAGALVVLLPVTRTTGAQERQPEQRPKVASEVIVKYRHTATETDKTRARGRVKGVRKERVSKTKESNAKGETELVGVPRALTVDASIAALSQDPAVEYAEPNWIYTIDVDPTGCKIGWTGVGDCTSDPSFDQQWGLNNTGQAINRTTGAIADADIDVPEAWAFTTGLPSVYVAVIDEGVNFAHKDLLPQVWTNPFDLSNGVDNDGNGYIDDIHGWDFANNNNTVYDGTSKTLTVDAHGTHVSGIIGAAGNNKYGVAGVAQKVTIIPAKFIGPTGGTTAAAVMAIDYIVNLKLSKGLDIVAINASWGGGGFSQALLDAITRAAQANILFIAAAGNGGYDALGDDNDAAPSYPANYDTTAGAGYDSVITVAATGRSDQLSSYSNFGMLSVDLGAPGDLILSTTPGGKFSYYTGTSMAAPFVTGAAALVHAARGLSGAQLRSALLYGVDPVPALHNKSVTGGRLNVKNSMTVVVP